MAKVWIVTKDDGYYGEPYPKIMGVFSSEEKSDKWIKEHGGLQYYEVEEWEVN